MEVRTVMTMPKVISATSLLQRRGFFYFILFTTLRWRKTLQNTLCSRDTRFGAVATLLFNMDYHSADDQSTLRKKKRGANEKETFHKMFQSLIFVSKTQLEGGLGFTQNHVLEHI